MVGALSSLRGSWGFGLVVGALCLWTCSWSFGLVVGALSSLRGFGLVAGAESSYGERWPPATFFF